MSLSQNEAFQVIFTVITGLVTGLLWGVVFFLKKLVHKVDLVDSMVSNVNALANRLDELVNRVELLNELKIEVATLKGRLFTRHGKNGEAIDSEDLT